MTREDGFLFTFRNGAGGLPPAFLEGDARSLTALLGAKGYRVSKLAAAGAPVPEGFILTTAATERFFRAHEKTLEEFRRGRAPLAQAVEACGLDPEVEDALGRGLDWLEGATGRSFGAGGGRLVVSVRAGATVSMPGVLDTLCNVGMNSAGPAELEEFWACDSALKFLEGYGLLVAGLDPALLADLRARFEGVGPLALGARLKALEGLVSPPPDPRTQVDRAVRALLIRSRGERASEYRRINYLHEELRLGILVQRMVFGNLNDRSGSGVVFTRDPSTGLAERDPGGARRLAGQFRASAQGSDVVDDRAEVESLDLMRGKFPEAVARLEELFFRLEREEKAVQDGEFTLEDGVPWVLQTRPAKMSPQGLLKAAVDMVEEGLLDEDEALGLMGSRQFERLLYSSDPPPDLEALERIGTGRPLVPGVAVGRLVFSAGAVDRFKARNEPTILCRENLRNEDVRLMDLVNGLVSCQKNRTSHATLVARATGHPALVEASLEIDSAARVAAYVNRSLDRVLLPEGSYVTVDATRGLLYRGRTRLHGASLSDPVLASFLGYLQRRPTLKVFTQTEDEDSFRTALSLGADGLGYFRSDVIFFKREVNFALCALLLAKPEEQEARAGELAGLLFREYSELLRFGGAEIGVRLIKHSMPEFFPTAAFEVQMLAERLLRLEGGDPSDARAVEAGMKRIRERRRVLRNYNPILGLRGVRLATAFPAVFEAQLRAFFRALRRAWEAGRETSVDLYVPYLSLVQEFLAVKELASRLAAEELGGVPARWRAVPEIEVSGIALETGELAKHCDRLVIRSDRLTTSTHHLVREDSHAFLGEYVGRGWFYGDPFRIIQKSTETLVATAVEAARAVNPGLRLMVAGDHCANEYSLRRLLRLGITEVCCPPRMVPLVKLIALNLERVGLRPRARGCAGPGGTDDYSRGPHA